MNKNAWTISDPVAGHRNDKYQDQADDEIEPASVFPAWFAPRRKAAIPVDPLSAKGSEVTPAKYIDSILKYQHKGTIPAPNHPWRKYPDKLNAPKGDILT
jgi:hypothetical protein